MDGLGSATGAGILRSAGAGALPFAAAAVAGAAGAAWAAGTALLLALGSAAFAALLLLAEVVLLLLLDDDFTTSPDTAKQQNNVYQVARRCTVVLLPGVHAQGTQRSGPAEDANLPGLPPGFELLNIEAKSPALFSFLSFFGGGMLTAFANGRFCDGREGGRECADTQARKNVKATWLTF